MNLQWEAKKLCVCGAGSLCSSHLKHLNIWERKTGSSRSKLIPWPLFVSPHSICILHMIGSVVYVFVLESRFVIRELQHAGLLSSLKVQSYICIWMSPRPLCLPTRYPPKTPLLTQSSYGKTNFIKFSITHQAEPIFLPMQLTARTFTIIWLQPLWKKSERGEGGWTNIRYQQGVDRDGRIFRRLAFSLSK